MKTMIVLFTGLLLAQTGCAQERAPWTAPSFTQQDSLRGSITPERAWWDLTYYHLDVTVDPEGKSLEGRNAIHYRVLEPGSRMQIDLQSPLALHSAVQDGRPVPYSRDGNVYWLELASPQEVGEIQRVDVTYGGIPKPAENAPWDGGFSWAQDELGNPFVATSCQGLGASVWWPCKDHMYDEVDSMLISVTVPLGLSGVSNGRLRKQERRDDGWTTFHWFVSNPINNYGVNVNIGDYASWNEVYAGEAGPLELSFHVLRPNEERARLHFRDVHRMLEAFEHWFGPYPFREDGYKLVEVPYLGMEHQSSITYGNGFQDGYRGRDLSGSGWGLKFDFIIIHESGHEWFANNITYRDIADMWIHEGFTAYSENLFVDYWYGTEASAEYVIGTRSNIRNDRPIIGEYDVNFAGSGDMYYKGANMLHTIRTVLGDDDHWRRMLRGLNETFWHQTVTTEQIESWMIQESGLDLAPIFDQYLRDTRIPLLKTEWDGNMLAYKWDDVVEGFNMPIEIRVDEGQSVRLVPTTTWQSMRMDASGTVTVDKNYYVRTVQAAEAGYSR